MALFNNNASLFGGADFSSDYSAGTGYQTGVFGTPQPPPAIGAAPVQPPIAAPSYPTKITNDSANKNTERTTNSTGSKTTNVQGTSQERAVRDLQSVTDPVLQALEAAIAGNSNQQTLAATDETRRKNMEAIMAAIQGFDAEAIQQGARGDVDQLTRELLEDTLPEVTGAVEASGSSNNALGALLAQDAASRTGEAQARVQEQARANAQQEFLGMIQQATGASGQGSAVADNLIQLLNASKGMVDRGTIDTNKTYNQNETVISQQQENMREGQASVGSSNVYDGGAGGASGAIGGSGDNGMAAKLALLQSSLSPFQTLQDMTNTDPFRSTAAKRSGDAINRLATKLGLF